MAIDLTRADLIKGLSELISEIKRTQISADIFIVGGAALSLVHFERGTTVDIDVRFSQFGDVEKIVESIAAKNGWQDDWINVKAGHFIPSLGKDTEWIVIYHDAGVSVRVASAEVLLVMKLAAARKGRDYADVEKLMAITGISTIDELDELYESYFPAEPLPEKALRMLEQILSQGIPEKPTPPEPPQFE